MESHTATYTRLGMISLCNLRSKDQTITFSNSGILRKINGICGSKDVFILRLGT